MYRLLLLAAVFLVGAAGSGAQTRSCAGLSGSFAYVKGGALHVLDFPTCRDRVVVARRVRPPVRFSSDGRWIAFGDGSVSARGGAVMRRTGVWAPRGNVLASTTVRGGVVTGAPGEPSRRVVPDGWGAVSVLWTRQGSLLIARSRFPRKPYRQSIWNWHPETGTLELIAGYFRGVRAPALATVSPDGERVFWWSGIHNAASLAADGMPLESKRIAGGALGPRVIRSMLLYPDFLSWCRDRLVVAAGAGRFASAGKRLVVAGPPAWLPRTISPGASRSWVSPACAPDGQRVVASAGPSRDGRFGLERRSLWLLSLDGRLRRRLTRRRGDELTDESPRWSRDGHWLLFVRSGPTSRDATAEGRLYLVRAGDGRLFGHLARLGRTLNYYGRYGWSSQTDWYEPSVR